MGKRLLLHLLAVVAGWGMVAGLRPVVAGREGRQAAAEDLAPGKSSPRAGNPADIAAGKKLLQRLSAGRAEDGFDFDLGPGPPLSLQELIDEYRRQIGFDPTAPDAGDDVLEDHRILSHLLEVLLDGELGPDLAHSFRHGRLDAVDLHDSLALHLPGPAADDTLRIALYRHLAPLDPVRAAAVLQSLPEDEATRLKYEILSVRTGALTPDIAFALLSSVPPPADFYGRLRRFQAWGTVTENCHPQYGSDYLHWLEQLPSSVDRDFAAVAVAERLPTDDLASHQRLRALITGSYPLEGPPPR